MEVEAVLRDAMRMDAAGASGEALATLEAAASRLRATDPVGAVRLLVDAVDIALPLGGPDLAVTTAQHAVSLASAAGGVERLRAITRLGDALSWAGRHAEATHEWQRAARDLDSAEPRMLAERANALIRLGERDAHGGAYRALVAARATGDPVLLADALNLVTVAEMHGGRLREALRAAEELHAGTAGTATVDELKAIGLLAWVVAVLGDAPRARGLFGEAERLADALRTTSIGGLAQGLLALSVGASGDAADAFAARLATSRFGPVAAMTGLRPYGADLVEAYARAGRAEAARGALAAMLPVAIGSAQPRLIAPMLRAQGILEGTVEPFAQALAQHARWGNRYEEARTRLAFGEVLRRQRRRAEAREQLAAAAAAFERLGVITWRDRAVAELRLAGERTPTPRSLAPPGPESLTRQEGEILELVRAGLSNRAIAERLVLSVKTVEGHLTTIYGKFGVSSRTQMLAVLAGGGARDDG